MANLSDIPNEVLMQVSSSPWNETIAKAMKRYGVTYPRQIEEELRERARSTGAIGGATEQLSERQSRINEAMSNARKPSSVVHHNNVDVPQNVYGTYVVFDTETTGLSKDAQVIEIGGVEYKGGVPTGRQFHETIKPTVDVELGASKVHGYINEDLTGSRDFGSVYQDFKKFIGDSPLVAHNADFDVRMLDSDVNRVYGDQPSIAITNPVVDTLKLARQVTGRKSGNKLDDLVERYGIETPNRDVHGALLDSQILGSVFNKLYEEATNVTGSRDTDIMDAMGATMIYGEDTVDIDVVNVTGEMSDIAEEMIAEAMMGAPDAPRKVTGEVDLRTGMSSIEDTLLRRMQHMSPGVQMAALGLLKQGSVELPSKADVARDSALALEVTGNVIGKDVSSFVTSLERGLEQEIETRRKGAAFGSDQDGRHFNIYSTGENYDGSVQVEIGGPKGSYTYKPSTKGAFSGKGVIPYELQGLDVTGSSMPSVNEMADYKTALSMLTVTPEAYLQTGGTGTLAGKRAAVQDLSTVPYDASIARTQLDEDVRFDETVLGFDERARSLAEQYFYDGKGGENRERNIDLVASRLTDYAQNQVMNEHKHGLPTAHDLGVHHLPGLKITKGTFVHHDSDGWGKGAWGGTEFGSMHKWQAAVEKNRLKPPSERRSDLEMDRLKPSGLNSISDDKEQRKELREEFKSFRKELREFGVTDVDISYGNKLKHTSLDSTSDYAAQEQAQFYEDLNTANVLGMYLDPYAGTNEGHGDDAGFKVRQAEAYSKASSIDDDIARNRKGIAKAEETIAKGKAYQEAELDEDGGVSTLGEYQQLMVKADDAYTSKLEKEIDTRLNRIANLEANAMSVRKSISGDGNVSPLDQAREDLRTQEDITALREAKKENKRRVKEVARLKVRERDGTLTDREEYRLHVLRNPSPEQGSKEWHRQREGMVTASKLTDINPAAEAEEIAKAIAMEGLGLKKRTDNAYTVRGNDLEAIALKEFVNRTGLIVEEAFFETNENLPGFGVSPDGRVYDHDGESQGLIEIKNLNDKNFSSGYALEKYDNQMQLQMAVTGEDKVHFVVRNADTGEMTHDIIHADEERQKQLIAASRLGNILAKDVVHATSPHTALATLEATIKMKKKKFGSQKSLRKAAAAKAEKKKKESTWEDKGETKEPIVGFETAQGDYLEADNLDYQLHRAKYDKDFDLDMSKIETSALREAEARNRKEVRSKAQKENDVRHMAMQEFAAHREDAKRTKDAEADSLDYLLHRAKYDKDFNPDMSKIEAAAIKEEESRSRAEAKSEEDNLDYLLHRAKHDKDFNPDMSKIEAAAHVEEEARSRAASKEEENRGRAEAKSKAESLDYTLHRAKYDKDFNPDMSVIEAAAIREEEIRSRAEAKSKEGNLDYTLHRAKHDKDFDLDMSEIEAVAYKEEDARSRAASREEESKGRAEAKSKADSLDYTLHRAKHDKGFDSDMAKIEEAAHAEDARRTSDAEKDAESAAKDMSKALKEASDSVKGFGNELRSVGGVLGEIAGQLRQGNESGMDVIERAASIGADENRVRGVEDVLSQSGLSNKNAAIVSSKIGSTLEKLRSEKGGAEFYTNLYDKKANSRIPSVFNTQLPGHAELLSMDYQEYAAFAKGKIDEQPTRAGKAQMAQILQVDEMAVSTASADDLLNAYGSIDKDEQLETREEVAKADQKVRNLKELGAENTNGGLIVAAETAAKVVGGATTAYGLKKLAQMAGTATAAEATVVAGGTQAAGATSALSRLVTTAGGLKGLAGGALTMAPMAVRAIGGVEDDGGLADSALDVADFAAMGAVAGNFIPIPGLGALAGAAIGAGAGLLHEGYEAFQNIGVEDQIGSTVGSNIVPATDIDRQTAMQPNITLTPELINNITVSNEISPDLVTTNTNVNGDLTSTEDGVGTGG